MDEVLLIELVLILITVAQIKSRPLQNNSFTMRETTIEKELLCDSWDVEHVGWIRKIQS